MRVERVAVQGFRAFSGAAEFALDSDVVILVGDNGTGKTSLLDAILWGLTGEISRFGADKSRVVSEYSRSKEATVSLLLADKDGHQWNITRTAREGESPSLTLTSSEGVHKDLVAEAALRTMLWPHGAGEGGSDDTLSASFGHSIYLQQDVVSEFIANTSSLDRFKVVADLVGAGRLVELQEALSSSKNRWKRGLTDFEKEVDALRQQRNAVAHRLSALGDATAATDELLVADWEQWAGSAAQIASLDIHADGIIARSRSTEHALKQIAAVLRQHERRAADAMQLKREAVDRPDRAALEREVAEHEGRLKVLANELAAAQGTKKELAERRSAHRKAQEELRAQKDELALLAKLALRHLSDRCPVCEQDFDIAATRSRLEVLTGNEGAEGSEIDPLAEAARTNAELILNLEGDGSELTNKVASLRRILTDDESFLQRLNARLRELGIESADDVNKALDAAIAVDEASANSLREMTRTGEQLALRFTKVGEVAERESLASQISKFDEELRVKDAEATQRRSTDERTASLIETLKEGLWKTVDKQTRGISPLVQRIYASVDPHVSFTSVDLAASEQRKKGTLLATMTDPQTGATGSPVSSLSSSQLNALAISVFLAMNLGLSQSPLESMILDDPLQSLDDINLLGMVDVLRRARHQRQMIVSTHDEQFSSLLARKLRPLSEVERTRVIHFTSWNRSGPQVTVKDVPVATPTYVIASAS